MENEPLSQLCEFAASVLWGGAIGVLYEFCGIFRFGRKWRIAAADLFFWMMTGISTFVFLLAVNGGEPRGFMLLGTAGGAVLVRLTAGSFLHRLKLTAGERIMKKRARKRAVKASLHPAAKK